MNDLTNINTNTSIKKLNRWFSIVVALLIIIFVIKCISVALTTAFSMDGAIFAQVAQNLAKNLSYATNYQTNYKSLLFDPKIGTGIPFILPIAISFSLFGESFASGLMVNAIYLVLLICFLTYYLKSCCTVSNFLTVVAILLLFSTPNLFLYGFALLGEIPMLFYLLLVLIFISRYETTARSRFLYLAGLSLGLGYLTKTVILICVPALIFASIYDYLIKRRLNLKKWQDLKVAFWEYFQFSIGFLIPLFGFEIFKLISLGSSYLRWWRNMLGYTLQFAGVKQGFTDTASIINKFIIHINKLSSFLGINVATIALLLLILLITFSTILICGIYFFHIKQKSLANKEIIFSNHFIILITVTISYYGWWLVITPTELAWERYIFPGNILLEICLILIASYLIKYLPRLSQKISKMPYPIYGLIIIAYISILIIGTIHTFLTTRNYLISFKETSEKTALLKAGQFVHNLPQNAELFGYYYWQAPIIAFTSGRIFNNILTDIEMRNAGPLYEKYLVQDANAYLLDPGGEQYILNQYDYSLAYSEPDWKIYIYKLNFRNLFAYKEFTDNEKNRVNYSQMDFRKNSAGYFTRNVYIKTDDNSGDWVQDVSGYLFKYSDENTLKIDLWLPSLNKFDQTPVELNIYANHTYIFHDEINQDGPHELIIPMKRMVGNSLEISLICNARFDVQTYGYPMAFMVNDIELINK